MNVSLVAVLLLQEFSGYLYDRYSLSMVAACELEFYMPVVGEELMRDFLALVSERLTDVASFLPFVIQEEGFVFFKDITYKQYEVKSIWCRDLVAFVDALSEIRWTIVRVCESLLGTGAIFDSKPDVDSPGSSMQMSVHLVCGEVNVFTRLHGVNSCLLNYAIGGMCTYAKQHMLYFAPTEASYLRFLYPDIYTPMSVTWGIGNRSVAFRVVSSGFGCRLEHRLACSDADPGLVLSAILYSITRGLSGNLEPVGLHYGLANIDDSGAVDLLPRDYNEARECFVPCGNLGVLR